MTYLVDADWISSFLNGRPDAIQLIAELADEGLALSVIAYGEIYEGLLSGRNPERLSQFEDFCRTLDIVAPNIGVARQYASVRLALRSQSLLIPDNDLWIAATALAHGLSLVSRDEHFARVPGLKLYRAPEPRA